MNIEFLKQQLPDFQVIYFDSIGSTSDYLDKLDPKIKAVVIADEQTAGRGRSGDWHSPKVGNLYFSFNQEVPTSNLLGLSPAIAIAISRVLTSFSVPNINVKWPNDIYWSGKKLAGILIDSKIKNNISEVIIGIGINLQPTNFANSISIDEILGKQLPQEQLLTRIVKQIVDIIKLPFKDLKTEYLSFDCLLNRKIYYQIPGSSRILATVTGISDDGALVVDGGTKLLNASISII